MRRVHREVIEKVFSFAGEVDFWYCIYVFPGERPEGNIEYLVYLKKAGRSRRTVESQECKRRESQCPGGLPMWFWRLMMRGLEYKDGCMKHFLSLPIRLRIRTGNYQRSDSISCRERLQLSVKIAGDGYGRRQGLYGCCRDSGRNRVHSGTGRRQYVDWKRPEILLERGIPLLGINLGSLGFLAEVEKTTSGMRWDFCSGISMRQRAG